MKPCGTFDRSYKQDMAIVRTRLQWILLIVGLMILFAMPLYLGGGMLSKVNFAGIIIISVLGLNILMGYTGLINIGQAAFMAVGAYTAAILAGQLGFSFWLALPCSIITTVLVGLVFGLPSLRVKGFYLAMSTLAAQFIIPCLIANVRPDITGGYESLVVPAPTLGNFTFNSQTSMFYLIMPLMVVLTFFAKNLVRTGIGRAFIAIRDNDLAAEVMGISLFRYKLLAFMICAAYAGVAGSLWVFWSRAVNLCYFELTESIWYAGMIIVGGIGTTAGVFFGVVTILFLQFFATLIGPILGATIPMIGAGAYGGIGPLLFGVVIILFLVFEPRGIAHRWEIFKNSYRMRPFSY